MSANQITHAKRIMTAADLRPIVISLVLASLLLVMGLLSTLPMSDAWADIHVTDNDSPAKISVVEDGEADLAAAPDKAEAAGAEIADDEVPMYSGLGGGEPVSGGFGVQYIVIAGIVVVVAFFAATTLRTNGSINKMKSNIH